ncbi:MAG TPA: hypothetical protein VHE11_03480 [Steroidobacteraceae bacterium]|nr:hypothetical protein [Steroidobacteraceae bacterium]
MKLRIKGDSLRLRLTQGEMRALAEQGEVDDRIHFPGGPALVYRVRVDRHGQEISGSYNSNLIDIRIPEALAERWCGTDLVTLSASQTAPAGELRIVLEKDWACLAPREGEDESDNFPHPESGRSAKSC